MATQQRPPTATQQPPPAPGLDSVYNWFNTISAGSLGDFFGNSSGTSSGASSGGRTGGLGGLFGGSGSSGSAPAGGLSSLSPLGMVCKAPQLRPSPHEGVTTERIVYDQSSVYGRPPDSSPERRSVVASPAGIHPSLSPRRDAASSSFAGGATPSGQEGGGGGASASRRNSKVCAYEADKEDLLDQHVGYYLRHHPHIHALHAITRKRPGFYDLDGREIKVEWQYATEPGGQGFLVALDGPLRQPFADYMEMTEANAEYDSQGIGSRSALHSIPKEKRMSFHDQHKMYNRLEAMKVAKEQALVREKAADYVKDGREVPGDLMTKYKKTIQQKLDPGGRRASAARQRSQEMNAGATPVRPPSATSPYAGAATPQPPAASPCPAGSGSATPGPCHGAPEETAGPSTGNRSAGDFAIPAPDHPDTIGPGTLDVLSAIVPTGATTPAGHKGSDGFTRYGGQGDWAGGPERQHSGPLFGAPERGPPQARPRARTESPLRRQQYQWPSYVPPAVRDASGASYVPPPVADVRDGSYVPPTVAREGRGGSYVPPVMHEGLSRSYVPPVELEFPGGPPENRSGSNEWTGGATSPAHPGPGLLPGVGPYGWAGAGPASGGGSGGGSPHNQGPSSGSAGRQSTTPVGGRSTAAQLLGPQPSLFGTPLAGTQMGQSPLGSGPMGPGSLGLGGLSGGIGPGGPQQQQQQQQQQQYAWWQQ